MTTSKGRTAGLAEYLRAAGIRVSRVRRASGGCDGEIRLAMGHGTYHVQVGREYAVLCAEEGDGEDFAVRELGSYRDDAALLAAIRSLVASSN